jgi:HK97 family phage portal protein
VPIVLDPTYGPKPSLQLLGGSNAGFAVPSVPFMPHGRSITMSGDGLRTVSYAGIYRSQPIVGATIRRMSEAIARLPLQVHRFLDDAGDTRERDRKHAASKLLERPRPGQRGFHLRWDIALSTYVHGNYVGWKRRPSKGAPPAELWTLDWRLLVPLMAGERVLGWRWLGEDGSVPGLRRNETILVENTVHLAFGAPGGGAIGVSPLEQLGVTVRSEDAIQRFAEANFRHGTRFGYAAILDPKAKADKVLRDGVRDELIDAHGGVDQAYRPAILGGGITDIKPLGSQTAAEAELIEQRKVNAVEFAAVVGIPAALAGILEDVNYASLKELHRILYVTSLGGPLGLIGESLQAQLLDAEPVWDADNRFLEWLLDAVLAGDAKERWETYAIALDHGGLTLNDVRRKENLKPYEDPRANEPLIAANNVRPLSAVGTGGTNVVEGNRELARILEQAAAAGDVDRVALEAELAGALIASGLNGSSAAIAERLAAALETNALRGAA